MSHHSNSISSTSSETVSTPMKRSLNETGVEDDDYDKDNGNINGSNDDTARLNENTMALQRVKNLAEQNRMVRQCPIRSSPQDEERRSMLPERERQYPPRAATADYCYLAKYTTQISGITNLIDPTVNYLQLVQETKSSLARAKASSTRREGERDSMPMDRAGLSLSRYNYNSHAHNIFPRSSASHTTSYAQTNIKTGFLLGMHWKIYEIYWSFSILFVV